MNMLDKKYYEGYEGEGSVKICGASFAQFLQNCYRVFAKRKLTLLSRI